jgi:hypothetical protein
MDFLFEIFGAYPGPGFVGVLVVLVLVFSVLAALGNWPGEILATILVDRTNRNDRGKGKRSSDKFVVR